MLASAPGTQERAASSFVPCPHQPLIPALGDPFRGGNRNHWFAREELDTEKRLRNCWRVWASRKEVLSSEKAARVGKVKVLRGWNCAPVHLQSGDQESAAAAT